MRSVMAMTLALCGGVSVAAQSGGPFQIEKSVIAGGGGRSSGGTLTLEGTIGQSVAGTTSSGGTFQVAGGFWGGSAPPVSSATISGTVTTPDGRGLRNAIVRLTDQLGTSRSVITSAFGSYTFESVATGQTYTLSVQSRRYRFPARSLTVTGNLTGVDFVGLE